MNDTIYAQTKALALQHGRASVALVQRHLRLGYGAACGLFERMQAEGLVEPVAGADRQWVLVKGDMKP
jgi:DNA segregation ATPase FtsK/SpoIIIE and related proteins